jgi:type III pantothenate kinase
VILQGMALGKAVVGPDAGGAREQIEDDVSGVLVPIGDPFALATAIGDLLKDPDRRAALGRAATARVREAFGGDVFAERLLEAYRSVGVAIPSEIRP